MSYAQEQDFEQVTVLDVAFEPPLPVTVSVTVSLRFGGKLCDVVTPLPVLPPPKFHEYDVAFDDVLASNERLRLEQQYGKLATGAGPDELPQ